ncbi:MAG: hypothetical protein GY943_09000 [Chloroflexi bacterium]|nr:hypothetical protein [Chloroflexota bacterium]
MAKEVNALENAPYLIPGTATYTDADSNALFFAAHFAFPGLLRISQTQTGWLWQTVN